LAQLNEHLQQEIAERRRVEVALQESQRSLSTLLSNLPGMAYRCCNDPTGPWNLSVRAALS
jgi:PAS domain-containing protein